VLIHTIRHCCQLGVLRSPLAVLSAQEVIRREGRRDKRLPEDVFVFRQKVSRLVCRKARLRCLLQMIQPAVRSIVRESAQSGEHLDHIAKPLSVPFRLELFLQRRQDEAARMPCYKKRSLGGSLLPKLIRNLTSLQSGIFAIVRLDGVANGGIPYGYSGHQASGDGCVCPGLILGPINPK